MKEVIEKVKELVGMLNDLPVVSLQDQKIIDSLNYWLKSYNQGNANKKRGSVLYDKLVKERTGSITRFDNVEEVVKAREAALKEHRAELAQKEEQEAEEDYKEEVLATSEEKPKRKTRSRRKKTD
jgi:septal ring factor EnvC (AmiA/AmiB activator)